LAVTISADALIRVTCPVLVGVAPGVPPDVVSAGFFLWQPATTRVVTGIKKQTTSKGRAVHLIIQ
jgi:hypothetical protein